MASKITVEFVGDTSKLERASDKASTALVKDLQGAAGDLARVATQMAAQFESKLGAAGGDAGVRMARDLKAQKSKFAAAGDDLGESVADRIEKAMDGVSGRVGTKVGPGFVSLGGKLGGKIMGGFAALGIGAVVAGQISEGMDVSAGVDKLQAQLGLTAKEAGRIGELAGDTYAGAWGESMTEVQGFYEKTMRAFPKLTDEALQKVTESAATTADVWDQDFNEVVRAAQNLLVNGLAPDAQTAMDMVATALQKTKGPQDEVLAALEEYTNHFALVGLEGSSVLGALTSKWATNQYAIDKVGDAVKELPLTIQGASDETKDALKGMGLSIGEVETAWAKGGETATRMTKRMIRGILAIEDPVERGRVGVALMGTSYEDLGNNAVPILRDVLKGQKNLTDTVEVGNKAYDNAKSKLTSWKRQGLQVVTEFIGNKAIPAVEDFAGEIGAFVKEKHIDQFARQWSRGLKDWVEDTDDWKQKWRERWRRSLGGWLQDTDGWQDKWARRWDRAFGGWLDDTDDYKEKWRSRWDRTLGRWLGMTKDKQGNWREGWRGSLGKWLDDTDDWKQKWLNRMSGAYTAVKRDVIDPIARLWNSISSPFGGPTIGKGAGSLNKMGEGRVIRRAAGGAVPGTGSGDTVPAWLTPGEHVWTKDEVKAAGGHRVLQRIRDSVRSGRGLYDSPTGGDPQRFAQGGIVAAQRFAQAQHGKSYIWGARDCSMFMSAILNVLEGKTAWVRRFTTGSIHAGLPGLRAGLGPRGGFSIGSYYGSPGHMAGTLGGVNVEAGGSPSLVKYNRGIASGADHPRFNRHFHAEGAFDYSKLIKETADRIINRLGAGLASGLWGGFSRAMVGTARSRMLAKVDAFEHGTDYVPYTGLAMVHKGERITPAHRNRSGPATVVNINVAGSVISERQLFALFRKFIKTNGGVAALGRVG